MGVLAILVGLVGALGVPTIASAGDVVVVAPVDLKADGTLAYGDIPSMRSSSNGRYVAFTSTSTTILPGLPSTSDGRILVRDMLTEHVEVASVKSDGTLSTGDVEAISDNGRFVVFTTTNKLVPIDTNNVTDVYVRDLKLDQTELISVNVAGTAAAGGGIAGPHHADISADGRYVVFPSTKPGLVADDNDALANIFRRDRQTGTTEEVDLAGATRPDADSAAGSISADGRWIVFTTLATNLDAADTGGWDSYLADADNHTVEWISRPPGASTFDSSIRNSGQVSDDGRYVAFDSNDPELVAGDANGGSGNVGVDVFRRDTLTDTTVRASVSSTGAELAGPNVSPSISSDGSAVGFTTLAQAVPTDVDASSDFYQWKAGTISLLSETSTGAQPTGSSSVGLINDAGGAFVSAAKLNAVDTNSAWDPYLRRSVDLGPHATLTDLVTHQLTEVQDTTTPQQIADAESLVTGGRSLEHWIVGLSDAATPAATKSVTRLYWAYFKRRPDYNGLQFWLRQKANGKSLQKISLQFAKSSEFTTKYGNTTSTQFVTLVYQNVLEREPEAGGLAYWANKIDRGTSRGQVMTSFSESSEGIRRMSPYVGAITLSLSMGAGIPSLAVFDEAVATLKAGEAREVLVDLILDSPEYAASL